jgi:hypothetical protein
MLDDEKGCIGPGGNLSPHYRVPHPADQAEWEIRFLQDFAPRVRLRLLLARWLYRTGRISDWGLKAPPPMPESFRTRE